MGSNQSTPQSPQLTQPLPKLVLETMMEVPKLPSLMYMLYGEEKGEEQSENEMEKVPIRSVVNMNDFVQVSEAEKLNLLMMAINKINTSFQYKIEKFTTALVDEEDGVFPRLREVETDMDNMRTRIADLEEDNECLKSDMHLLKGIVQVQQNQIEDLKQGSVEVKARSMKNNILIDGILQDTEDEKECKQQALTFLREQLQMVVEEKEVIKAHRIGEKKIAKNRVMVVKCETDLRQRIFGYTKNLKGKVNGKNQSYYVDPQLPEVMVAQKRKMNQSIAKIKHENKDREDKVTFKVKGRQLFINNELQKDHITPPPVTDLIQLNQKDRKKIEELKVEVTDEHIEKNSVFKAYAKKVSSLSEMRKAYLKIRLLHPEADHIVAAYKVPSYEGSCDDGEHTAGQRLLKLMTIKQKEKCAVFVARKYGGQRLGPKRFMLYQNLAAAALEKI